MKTMNQLLRPAMLLLCGLVLAGIGFKPVPGWAAEGGWDKYLWETCRCSAVPASASNLVTELRAEVDKVLASGPLAPMRTVYADLEEDPYFMYWQGGRIVTTLAMAWPHLTESQRIQIRSYIRAELEDEQRAPWAPKGFIPPDRGSRREQHALGPGPAGDDGRRQLEYRAASIGAGTFPDRAAFASEVGRSI